MNPNPSTSATRTLLSLAIGLALSANLTTTLAAPGALDTTFSSYGVQYNDVSGNDEGRAVAVQADGKILIGGYSNTIAPHFFGLLRYNANGTLDTSFSGDGIGGAYLPSDSPADSVATALAIQADGQILQAGYSGGNFALVRYNSSNGQRDTTFGGGDGIVITDLGGNDSAMAMAIQPDGKILLAGHTDYAGNPDFALVRYNSDGSLDTSFDSDGILIDIAGSSVDQAYALAVQADGKILLAGSTAYFDQQTNEPPYIHLRRYNSNGTLDTTFGTNGLVVDYSSQAGSEAYTLAVQPDGKILLAGYGVNDANKEMVVLRYLSTGALDTGFATAGKITGRISYDGARTLALQPDGKILIGGDIATYNGISETWDFALARYNSNGTADTGFGAGGDYLVSFDISGSDDHAYGMALQPDGKILLGGSLSNGSNNDYAVLRVIASDIAWDLTPDNFLFNDAGTVAASTLETSASVQITGLGTSISVPVSITGGEYAIGSNDYTSEPGYIQNGSFISVRHTAAATESTATNTVLTIGGLHAANSLTTILGTTYNDSYTSTTLDAPNAFSFTDQTGVAQATTITSNTITLAGLSMSTTISVSNGEYSLDGINFVSTGGTVNNGDSITLRHTSASAAATSVNTILTIGGVADTFTSTTASAAAGGGSSGGGGGGALSWPSLLLMGLPLLWHRRPLRDSTAR